MNTIDDGGKVNPQIAAELVACERALKRWQRTACRTSSADRFPFCSGYAEAIEDIRSGKVKVEGPENDA